MKKQYKEGRKRTSVSQLLSHGMPGEGCKLCRYCLMLFTGCCCCRPLKKGNCGTSPCCDGKEITKGRLNYTFRNYWQWIWDSCHTRNQWEDTSFACFKAQAAWIVLQQVLSQHCPLKPFWKLLSARSLNFAMLKRVSKVLWLSIDRKEVHPALHLKTRTCSPELCGVKKCLWAFLRWH